MPYDAPDVAPEVAALQARGYRAMSADAKLAVADGMWELAWELTRAGIRMRQPELDAAGVDRAARAIMRRASD